MKRRTFLHAVLGAGAATLPGCGARAEQPHSLAARPASLASARTADLELVLHAAPERVPVLAGAMTEVMRFTARLVHGAADALVRNDSGYLGPTLRVKRGQRVRVQFENGLGEDTIVHWHGLQVSEKNDGHPAHAVGPGGRYAYDFEVRNRAGTYWYHPHPDGRTGPQVYQGLAGLLLVSDDDEQRLGLPDRDRELTLALQDRTFDPENQLVYAPNRMLGFLGEQVLVNGRLATTREVPRGPHRLRILNASNSRIYDLAWSDGSALTVLGTDGGFLAAPRAMRHVVLAPGQRLDLWANFGDGLGDDVWLESRAFDDIGPAMGMGMGRGRAGGVTRASNGQPLRLQHFVASGRRSPDRAPPRLAAAASVAEVGSPASSGPARVFPVGMAMMRWVLNGRPFELRGVAANERVRLGAVEDWEFTNPAGPMAMAHPIHVHGSQFRVIARQPGPGLLALREGILDEGWHDTFLLLPGNRVRIQKRFERDAGLFLYHCHNLEHEDMGMMRNFLVEA